MMPKRAGKGSRMNRDWVQNRDDAFHVKEFGRNVYFFAPEDEPKQVQAVLDSIWRKQETSQFGKDRIAVYFLPGVYSEELRVYVGFYTQAAGMGLSPDDTVLPFVQANANWLNRGSKHNATCNFWRGVENLRVTADMMWAVSQATYMRRMHVDGRLELHDHRGWASGGFLADSLIEGIADSGTQQQWLSRNCDWQAWTGENWNLVFAGIEEGKAPRETWPEKTYTAVPVVEAMREKPYLAWDENRGLGVALPCLRTDSAGISWKKEENEKEAGRGRETDGQSWIPMEEFYIAKAGDDTAASLNQALKEGKHLFFTPGIYELDEELLVERPNTMLLGTGLATLVSVNGNRCIRVLTDEGITIAGFLFDIKCGKAPALVQVGREKTDGSVKSKEPGRRKEGAAAEEKTAAAPTLLADVFFRVGGETESPVALDCCLIINSDYVLGDNFWVWRADHGTFVGWENNIAENGMIVNGDHVTVYALMVEHFRQYQTVWNGEDGKTIMYQSEIPYDVPDQESWRSHEGTRNGYASYYVAPHVRKHEAWGLGIYSVFLKKQVELFCAAEVPEIGETAIHNICAVMITGYPGISHVINGLGGSCMSGGERQIVTEYLSKQ